MTKLRTKPSIAKPVIDTKAALEFIAAQHGSASAEEKVGSIAVDTSTRAEIPAGFLRLDVTVKEELLERLEAEARRKGKTVAEMVSKLITKHISKH